MSLSQSIRFMANRSSLNALRAEVRSEFSKSGKESGDAFADQWTSSLTRIKEKIVELGVALGIFLGIEKIVRFGEESVKAYSEADRASTALNATLKNLGINTDSAAASIMNLQTANRRLGFTNADTLKMIETYAVKQGSLTDIQKANLAITSLAVFKQMDLQQATMLVTQAMDGNIGRLQRYVGGIDKSGDVLDQINKKLKGIADTFANSFAGKVDTAAAEWDNLKENIGKAMVEAGSGVSIMDTLIATIKSMTDWVKNNQKTIEAWGEGLKATGVVLTWIGTGISTAWKILLELMIDIVAIFKSMPDLFDLMVGKMESKLADFIKNNEMMLAFVFNLPVVMFDAIANKLNEHAIKAIADAKANLALIRELAGDAVANITAESPTDTGLRGDTAGPGKSKGRTLAQEKEYIATLTAEAGMYREMASQAQTAAAGVAGLEASRRKFTAALHDANLNDELRLAIYKEINNIDAIQFEAWEKSIQVVLERSKVLSQYRYSMVDLNRIEDEVNQRLLRGTAIGAVRLKLERDLLEIQTARRKLIESGPHVLTDSLELLQVEAETSAFQKLIHDTQAVGPGNPTGARLIDPMAQALGDSLRRGDPEQKKRDAQINFDQSTMGQMVESLRAGAGSMESVWAASITKMITEFKGFSSIVSGVFGGLGKAMAQGLAGFFQTKAAQNLAQAIEDGAFAVRLFWEGQPEGAAIMLANVGKDLAAAAAWTLAAGIAGAAGSGGGGSSGSGGSSGTGGFASSTAQSARDAAQAKQPFQITVYAFNKDNPVDQNNLGGAIEQYIERAGSKVIYGSR